MLETIKFFLFNDDYIFLIIVRYIATIYLVLKFCKELED